MKNIKKEQLKKCIFMSLDEHRDLILNITDGLKSANLDLNGLLYYDDTDKAIDSDTYWNEYTEDTLSKYYGIKVKSIHLSRDLMNNIGVWICYQENESEFDKSKCCHCGSTVDIENCDTNKYWTNNGDHVLFHICPNCGDSVEEMIFN